MQLLKTTERSFGKKFEKLLRRGAEVSPQVEKTVRSILADVRRHGDRAVLKYTERFDRFRPSSLEVSAKERARLLRQVKGKDLAALKLAARRIRNFHTHQLPKSWTVSEKNGPMTGELFTPLQRVGIYVPGGKATYPSSVLMNAIPAAVAGVPEIVMVTPCPGGALNPMTVAAAELAGVTRIFKVGGAQGIAALAYGTKSIPVVDKIVGPGNLYVATAKRLVFGQVGIDMIAGPTEIVIIADEDADPEFVAADLLSQAEHDEEALPILITPSQKLIAGVKTALNAQLASLPRRAVLDRSLKKRGLMILVRNLAEAVELSNGIAPEHLELAVRNPSRWLLYIKNAGAIFLNTPVAFGDYLAGPNHVLPTGRTARFSSPLGVLDFLKRSSVIDARSGLKKLAPPVVRLAKLEGLTAHAASVEIRINSV